MHTLTYRGTVAVDQRWSYRGELCAGDMISVRSAIIELGDDPSPWESWPPSRMFTG